MKKDYVKIIRALAASGASPEEIVRQPMIKAAGFTIAEIRQVLGITPPTAQKKAANTNRTEKPETPEPPKTETQREEPEEPTIPDVEGEFRDIDQKMSFTGRLGDLGKRFVNHPATRFGARGVGHTLDYTHHMAGDIVASAIEKRGGLLGKHAGKGIRHLTRRRMGLKTTSKGSSSSSGVDENVATKIDSATKGIVSAIREVEKKFDSVMGKVDVSIKTATSKMTDALDEQVKVLKEARVSRMTQGLKDDAAEMAGASPAGGGRLKRLGVGAAALGLGVLGAGALMGGDSAQGETDHKDDSSSKDDDDNQQTQQKPQTQVQKPPPAPVQKPKTDKKEDDGQRPEEIDFQADTIVFKGRTIEGLPQTGAAVKATSRAGGGDTGPAPNSQVAAPPGIPGPPEGAFEPDFSQPTPEQLASGMTPAKIKKWAKSKVAQPKMGRVSKDFVPDKNDSRAVQAMKFFTSKGWTKEQAMAIVGNLQAESQFNTKAIGDKGEARGIAQWHQGRWNNYLKFLKKSGLHGGPDSYQNQLAFVNYELHHGEKAVGDRLASTNDYVAAAYQAVGYERPAGYDPRHPWTSSRFKKRYEYGERAGAAYEKSLRDNKKQESSFRQPDHPHTPTPVFKPQEPKTGAGLTQMSIKQAARKMAPPPTPLPETGDAGKGGRLPQQATPSADIDPSRFGDPLPTSHEDHFKNYPGLTGSTPHPGLGS